MSEVESAPGRNQDGKPDGTLPLKPRPAAWVPTLYFAEGLPNVVTVMVSVVMYRKLGLSDAEIAFFTSLITYPWVLKPLWSPLMELVRNQKRAVLLTQLLGGVAFAGIAMAIPSDNFLPITLGLFALIAFNAATHDIVADGIYVNVLDSETQAKYVGIQGASYNIARFAAQGGIVVIAGSLEKPWGVNPAWMAAMATVGVIMVVLSVIHARTLPAHRVVRESNQSVGEVWDGFKTVVVTFCQKKGVWWALAFICLFRFSEGNQVKIVPLFLMGDRAAGGLGLSTTDVGVAYGFAASIAFVGGSLAGGYLTSRIGLRRSLLILCAAFNIPNVCYLILATLRPESLLVVNGVVLIETFGWGFGFVGLPLYIMQELAPGKFKMAHYAFGTAVMFLGFLVPSTFSGYISDALGYKMHFVWVLVATIPSFIVAWRVPIFKDPRSPVRAGHERQDPEEGDPSESSAIAQIRVLAGGAILWSVGMMLLAGVGGIIDSRWGHPLWSAAALACVLLGAAKAFPLAREALSLIAAKNEGTDYRGNAKGALVFSALSIVVWAGYAAYRFSA